MNLIETLDSELSQGLYTSVVDYNLVSLNALLNSEAIRLRPDYQRRFRWTSTQQSKLLESFFLNMPIPPIYLSEDGDATYSVIDGQQRLTTIREFLANRLVLSGLELVKGLNGKCFEALPAAVQRRLMQRSSLRAIIVLETSSVPDIALRVFERLNTGTKALNSLEIRNSVFRGPLNDTLTKLSEHSLYRRVLWQAKAQDQKYEKESLYRHMTDVEFVLRFFTFCDTWQTFRGLMSAHMDQFMLRGSQAVRVFGESSVTAIFEDLGQRFLQSVRVADAAFGANAFRPWRPKKQQFDPGPRSAIVDAQLLGCQGFSPEEVRQHREPIVASLAERFEQDDKFISTLTRGSNHNQAVKYRVQVIRGVIAAHVAA